MRDENGTFIGNTDCIHWNGVAKVETKTCCGGRVTRCAKVNCVVKGEVFADFSCFSACSEIKLKKGV